MRRFLPALGLGLILTSCEKPAPAGEAGEKPAPTAPPGHRERRPRDPAPDPSPSPREVLEAADALDTPAAREKAIAGVAWNAIETDPALAHEAFLKLPPESPEKLRLIRHYAMSLAETDVEAALEWAVSLGSEMETSAAETQIALALAETDPRRAAKLLSESGIAGRDLDVAVVQVIQRWAAQSAPDAAAWAVAFPPGPAREAGIAVVAGSWLPGDPPAAFAWLGALTAPQVRAEAARAMKGVILQQPEEIRNAWLEHADAAIRAELQSQRGAALLDVGDNIPSHAE